MKNQLIATIKNAASLKEMGGNIKLARKVRGFTVTLLASYAGISRSLLYKIEAGNPTVAIGAFYAVLQQLGLEQDFAIIAFRKGITKELLNQHPAKCFRRAWYRKRQRK